MDRLLRLKVEVGKPMICADQKQEKILRSLASCSKICEYNGFQDSRGATHGYDYCSRTPRRIVPTPLVEHTSGCLENKNPTDPPHSLNKQTTLGQPNSCTIHLSPNIPSPVDGKTELSTSHYSSNNPSTSEAPFVMPGAHIPLSHPKLHPNHPPASHPPGCTSTTSSSRFPREDSDSSLLSLETRDSSIRIVKPNLTLSPPRKQKDKDATDCTVSNQVGQSQPDTMYGNKQNGQKGLNKVEGSRSRSKAMDEYSHSHSRSQPQHKQSFDAAESYGRGRDHSTDRLASKPCLYTSGGNTISKSTDRGRTMQRRYEFIDSDDVTYTELSPVQEAARTDSDGNGECTDNTGRESNMTTMTSIIQKCTEPSPTQPSDRQGHHKQQSNGGVSTPVVQPSPSQPTTKRHPFPLDLEDPVRIGMVRRTNRYEVEHVAIKSSRAEYFSPSPTTDLSKYDDRLKNPPKISPLNIPNLNDLRGIDPLELYNEWRRNLRHVRTASQGSVHITVPGWEEYSSMTGKTDEDQLPIMDYPVAQNTPLVNRVRSRSTLGIREDRDKEERQRRFSGSSVYTPSEYTSRMPSAQGPGVVRSATMNDVTHRGRRFSGGAASRASHNGNHMPLQTETEMQSPPFTPLTPFIMKVTGAPAGVERGAKTLFGEHGWLEDTAASGMAKPKVEKAGGFLENLKRKAREIADSTSFKPARNIRTSAVNRMNISLDAREQSLLYCELEYNLNNALDAYCRAQLNGGRLDATKLGRIADAWAQKGRPKVIGFRYDLETQVDLITAHINEFRFYGPLQGEGPIAITGLLHAMKTNARYMRIRTFCQPDSVIAKHVLDAQNFLLLLGSPESLQRPLEEVAQFFKVAVERRRVMAEAPPARQGDNRILSNGSGQRVRFQDEGTQRRRHYAEMPEVGKSRADVRDPSYGSIKPQSVKSQNGSRGPNQQRQFSDGAASGTTKMYGTPRGRSRSGHHQ